VLRALLPFCCRSSSSDVDRQLGGADVNASHGLAALRPVVGLFHGVVHRRSSGEVRRRRRGADVVRQGAATSPATRRPRLLHHVAAAQARLRLQLRRLRRHRQTVSCRATRTAVSFRRSKSLHFEPAVRRNRRLAPVTVKRLVHYHIFGTLLPAAALRRRVLLGVTYRTNLHILDKRQRRFLLNIIVNPPFVKFATLSGAMWRKTTTRFSFIENKTRTVRRRLLPCIVP